MGIPEIIKDRVRAGLNWNHATGNASTAMMDGLSDVQFGREMKDKEFSLSKDVVFANNGSYGTVPIRVQKDQQEHLKHVELLPDLWFRHEALGRWKKARDVVAEFVGADPENLVLVGNATTGVNTVLKSLVLHPGDAIMGSILNYQACINICKAVAARVEGCKVHYLDITFPIASEEELIDQYDKFLTEHPDVKIVLLDHISSSTAMVFPVKRLAEVIHQHNAMVLVDGAHAPGHVHLNLEELDVDFYTGNLHKWCFSPRSCALLWIHPRHHSWVSPLVTSHNYNKGLTLEFFMVGTMDYSAAMGTTAGLEFLKTIGGLEKINAYNSGLLDAAVNMLEKSWGTQRLQIPQSMEAPHMRLVQLPELGCEKTFAAAEEFIVSLIKNYKVVVQIVCVYSVLYARMSAQVYNATSDYERLDQVVKELAQKHAS